MRNIILIFLAFLLIGNMSSCSNKFVPDLEKTIIIPGSLTEQKNTETHTFKAPITGKYLFEVIDRTGNYDVKLKIDDSLKRECASSNNNFTVDLKEEEVYTIYIARNDYIGKEDYYMEYKLKINIPK